MCFFRKSLSRDGDLFLVATPFAALPSLLYLPSVSWVAKINYMLYSLCKESSRSDVHAPPVAIGVIRGLSDGTILAVS